MTNPAIESAAPVAAPAKREAFEYRLQVKGVFLRNRKVKSQGWTIGTSETKLDAATIATKAAEGLAKCGLKAGGQYAVIETPVTIEEHTFEGKTFRSTSFMCFSGVRVLAGAV
jgi:hypothetical protein